jgi:Mycothiol maleylpyruvate isomerase N-terminal domain
MVVVRRSEVVSMNFERHCAEIVAQTAQLTGYLDDADLSLQVPTCPGWNASQLMRHVDGGLRWDSAAST